MSTISQSILSTSVLEITTCLAVVYFKTLREFKVPRVWKTNATILQNLEVFSYCTSQSEASTSPPKQPPGYKFPIHVGQFKVIKCPTLGKLQSLCDLCQSTMMPQPCPLKSSNLPLSSYKLQDIHTLHVSCEIEAKVQVPQPLTMVTKFPTPMKIMTIKFPPPQNEKVLNALGMPKWGRAGGC